MRRICAALISIAAPAAAFAADNPFATGTAGAKVSLLAILTPIAAIAVMVSGTLGWFGRISWWWFVGVVVGTVLVFGSDQIVAWIRALFGV